MIKIGFIIKESPGQVFRGIDVTSQCLFPHLVRLASDYNCEIVAVSSSDDPQAAGCDLLHFPNYFLFFPSIPLNLTKPYVITLHDVIRLEFPDIYSPGIIGWLKLQYQKQILNRSRIIFTDSYSSVTQIRRYLHLPHEKIKLVYLAAPEGYFPIHDPKQLKDIKKKYQLPDKFVLFNGEIDWNKNLLGLIKAVDQINIPLVIYGKSSFSLLHTPEKYDFPYPELAHLPELKNLLNQSLVRVLGFVPDADLAVIFALASVYCQPSFAEGFGLPVLQALACGTPVACSNTHSLPEIAGDCAVYFDPNDQDSVTSALSKLLADPKLCNSLTAKGLVQAKKFSWEKAARETLAVYQQMYKS